MIPHKIYIVGSIDEDSFRVFCEELDTIENLNTPSKRVIYIDLNSIGGTAMDALAFYGRITRSKCLINITAYGLVASAAVLVFAAGGHRMMTKESWMMVHEDEDQLKHARTSQFEKQASHMRRLEDQWSELLEKHTDCSKEKWLELHKHETYLTAYECLALGIVDEII